MLVSLIRFPQTALRARPHVVAWMGLLVSVNLFGGIYFFPTTEGKVVIGSGSIAFVMMWILFHKLGYVRLLGIGHLPWVPMLVWLSFRLPTLPPQSPLGLWVILILVLNSISLVIDYLDINRYFRGERKPFLTLDT